MNKAIILTAFLCSVFSLAQVGINTTSPAGTLDITAKNATGGSTNVDGLLIPRVDRQRAQNMTNVKTSTLIFVDNISTGTRTGTAANIDSAGYYYYNGSVWTKLDAPSDPTADAWVDNPSYHKIELGAKSDGSVRTAGSEFVVQDNGNVGIGTATPNAAAIVDIASNNKGLKIPYVSLQSNKDLSTVQNPVDGLMVYNPGNGTTLPKGIYIFDDSSQSWEQLQKFSPTTGSIIKKLIYKSNSGDQNKTVAIGKYMFRINTSNIIQMTHSKADAPSETLSIVDNVFKSPDTFWYSAPKNLSLAAGNSSWSASSTGSISTNLEPGRVITIYFTDVTENTFYRVVFFRSADSPSAFSILAEQF